jgi:hypothetical protein
MILINRGTADRAGHPVYRLFRSLDRRESLPLDILADVAGFEEL